MIKYYMDNFGGFYKVEPSDDTVWVFERCNKSWRIFNVDGLNPAVWGAVETTYEDWVLNQL